MTPTLDQCRELERLYPGQWDNTEKVYAISKKESPDIPNIEGEPMLRLCAEAYADELTILAPAPSLGEMVRVLESLKIYYNIANSFVGVTTSAVPRHEGDTPEQALAAEIIAAGGG